MVEADIGSVPMGCMGSVEEVRERIRSLGSAAILGFDGDQHVAQLQFRSFIPDTRSRNTLWDPLYWMDFGEEAVGATDALAVFCYHVGQLDDSDNRDPTYMGRGIGLQLLDEFLCWAHGTEASAVVAKATPAARSVMAFMGGQPKAAYEGRGFRTVSSWCDDELAGVVIDSGLVEVEDLPDAATVACCVLEPLAGI